MSRRKASGCRKRAGCCCLLPVLALAGGAWWASGLLGPASSAHTPVSVTIRPGTGTVTAARLLADKGLIRSAPAFVLYAKYKEGSGALKAGAYRLFPDMTAGQIVERLQRGGADADDRVVTVPEGFTVKQIAEALVAAGAIKDADDFLSAAKSGAGLNAPFPVPGDGLEGYLFPDTYRFQTNTRPQKALQAMLDAFASNFYTPRRDEIERSGHTLHELVTIASLIEQEAKLPQDRARIAGVIENRLKRNMKLDIDATVLYALGEHRSRLFYKDLKTPSPYNTYLHKGLPPGPIASPGRASLEAALAPEHHGYLYYVANPDGSHVFAKTMAEHNRNVAAVRSLRTPTVPAPR